jgi:hypothetical protein
MKTIAELLIQEVKDFYEVYVPHKNDYEPGIDLKKSNRQRKNWAKYRNTYQQGINKYHRLNNDPENGKSYLTGKYKSDKPKEKNAYLDK